MVGDGVGDGDVGCDPVRSPDGVMRCQNKKSQGSIGAKTMELRVKHDGRPMSDDWFRVVETDAMGCNTDGTLPS